MERDEYTWSTFCMKGAWEMINIVLKAKADCRRSYTFSCGLL